MFEETALLDELGELFAEPVLPEELLTVLELPEELLTVLELLVELPAEVESVDVLSVGTELSDEPLADSELVLVG